MALFDLNLRLNHTLYAFRLNSTMSSNDIKHRVSESFLIGTDTFDIQVYDEYDKDSFVLDDEHVERLHERLPRTSTSTLFGDILRNNIPSNSFPPNQCRQKGIAEVFELEPLFHLNSVDCETTRLMEVSTYLPLNDEPVCFEESLATTVAEEEIDPCLPYGSNCLTNPFKPIDCQNSINLLSSNDEISRNICDSEGLYQPEDNRLHIIGNIDRQAQTVPQNILNTFIRQHVSVGPNPVELLHTDRNEQNSYDYSLDVPDQIAEQTPSVQLSTSLRFVHDVLPCQKTKHDTDNFDECSNKKIPPYIKCIQGFKTAVDKGRSILPKLKLPSSYMYLHQRSKSSLDLVVAVVRESVVDNKRHLYSCHDMLFLPADTNEVKKAVNPIKLDLHSMLIETDGTFRLSLRLVNMSSQRKTKQQDDRFYYELDEERVKNLHPTPHDPRFIRLACTIAKDNVMAWDTLCLSDYIQPKHRLQTRTYHRHNQLTSQN